MAIMTFQMEVLRKRAIRAEQEIKDLRDKHEEEMHRKKQVIIAQGKMITEERLENKQLKKELQDYEDNILQGIMPKESKENKDRSPQSSPEVPRHKKPKMDTKTVSDNLHEGDDSSLEITEVKKETSSVIETKLKTVPIYIDENGKGHYEGTTAYTTNTRDKANLMIATKNPKSIRPEASSPNERDKPKVLGAHLIKHQPRLPTAAEIKVTLEAWRAMLRQDGSYYPDKKKTPEEHLIDLKVLMGAKTSFKKSVHNNPIAQQQWKH
jgi:hypothetical protein